MGGLPIYMRFVNQNWGFKNMHVNQPFLNGRKLYPPEGRMTRPNGVYLTLSYYIWLVNTKMGFIREPRFCFVTWFHRVLRKILMVSRLFSLTWKLQTLGKGVVFFFPGKITFCRIFWRKEWVSEISGIFFPRCGKKNTVLFFSNIKFVIFVLRFSICNGKPLFFSKTFDPIYY